MDPCFSGQTMSWAAVDGALEVRLHRDPLNEIGLQTLLELEQLGEVITAKQHGCHALIWYSDRKGFCAGADLRALHAGFVERRENQRLASMADALGPVGTVLRRGAKRAGRPLIRREVRRFIDRIHRVFSRFDSAPILTIAAVNGVCFGGGFELALTADLMVAEKTARFCFPELRLGLVPGFGGIPRLQRDLGNAVVRDLLLTGRSVNAKRALTVGLVREVVPGGKGLDAARRIAEQAGRFDAFTLAKAKACVKPIPKADLARERELFCELVTRPAVSEALTKFVESDDRAPYLP
ncbi:MAG: hypothetical protein GWP91_20625 [Rhodobacterales bacterium]|nr:hypothetical protein [Rhodobacterales bacterium]